MQFALTLATPIALCCWGDECILFDPGSGDTHLLSRTGADLLEQLQQGPASVENLAAWFNIEPGTLETLQLHGQLQSILDDFLQLAMVECRPS